MSHLLRKEDELSKFWEVQWNTITQRRSKGMVLADCSSIQDTEGYQSPYISTPQVSQGKSRKHQLICPLSETVPGWGQRAPAECCDPHSRRRAGEKPSVQVTPHSSPFHAFWLQMLQWSGGFLVRTLVKTSGKATLATKLCSMRANRKISVKLPMLARKLSTT